MARDLETVECSEKHAQPNVLKSRVRVLELTWRLTVAALGRFTSDRVFGLWWWAVDPIIMITVYAIVFGNFFNLMGRDVPAAYPLFLACALIPWRWFSVSATRGANSFLANSGLLISTPVNRRALVMSELLASTFEAAVGILILVGFMLYYDRTMTWNLALLPLPLLIMGTLAAGISLLLCPLTVLFRDFSNIFAATLRPIWFLSPGLYSYHDVPERYRMTWAALNPFVGIFEGIRRPIHDGTTPLWTPLAFSAAWAIVMLLFGNWAFRRFGNASVRML